MALIHWKFWNCAYHFVKAVQSKYCFFKLCLYSLFYNAFSDKYYVGDTCMEPLFWIVDHFTKILGPVCVLGVMALMASIIMIAYVIGLPFWWQRGLIPTSIAVIIGHWILINVLFNYTLAYITSPGHPPEGALIPEAVSICKKCIAPKPPRTHHCSVCNVCVLKMDHHCPLLNNCVGHFNHRYFFAFGAYVWIGIVFIMIFGLPIAWEHFITGLEPINSTLVNISTNGTCPNSSIGSSPQVFTENAVGKKRTWAEAMYHSCIVYAALVCIAVFVTVGALLAWHSRLISRGETSIESHINKKEHQRLAAEGKVYKNPYDFGPKKNWLLFLGICNGRTWMHILFPSRHKPEGNGLQWHTQESIKWLGDMKGFKLKK